MPTPTVGQTVTFNVDGSTLPNPGSLTGTAAVVVAGRVLVVNLRDTAPTVLPAPVNVNTGTKAGVMQPLDVAVGSILTAT